MVAQQIDKLLSNPHFIGVLLIAIAVLIGRFAPVLAGILGGLSLLGGALLIAAIGRVDGFVGLMLLIVGSGLLFFGFWGVLAAVIFWRKKSRPTEQSQS